jgi:hypothetical protein
VAVLQQTGEGAEVDHGTKVTPTEAQLMSRTTLSVTCWATFGPYDSREDGRCRRTDLVTGSACGHR